MLFFVFCVCLICCRLLNAQAGSTTRAFQVSQGGQGVPGASEQGASAGSPHPYWSCGLRQVKEAGASRAHWLPVSDAPPALPAGSVRGAVEGGGAPWQPHSPHWLCLAGQLLPGGAAGVAVEWGLPGVVAQGLCPALRVPRTLGSACWKARGVLAPGAPDWLGKTPSGQDQPRLLQGSSSPLPPRGSPTPPCLMHHQVASSGPP